MSDFTTIDLLRHGEVVSPSLFSSPINEPLGMAGWKQLTLATQQGEWDVVFSSSTRRCHDFARLLAQRLDCPFKADDRLAELNFGDWIGLSQDEIFARDPERLQQYYFQPRRFIAPNGESMDQFMQRVDTIWQELIEEYHGQRILVLTHAGVIRVMLSKALDILYQRALRFDMAYARFTRIRIYPDGETYLIGHGLSNVKA